MAQTFCKDICGNVMSCGECGDAAAPEGMSLTSEPQGKLHIPGGDPEEQTLKSKVLLHACCAPCASAAVERLLAYYDVVLYYYNPNITDASEYEKRLADIKYFADEYIPLPGADGRLSFACGDYDPEGWLEAVRGFEDMPEGGDRCDICFRYRLTNAAAAAAHMNCRYFTTSLSVSPHKNFAKLFEIGREVGEDWGVSFLEEDFKKKNGFKLSVKLSELYGLYRQDYCGCEFSKRK